MQKILFGLAAIATATVTNSIALSPAMAQPPSITIETTGYDLASDSGYNAVAGRIVRAARQVCGSVDLRNLDMAPEVLACRDETQADAMAQLDRLAGSGRVTVVASR